MSRAHEMEDLIRRWESSGLSQRAFAAREGVSYSTFQHWRRRLGGSRATSKKASSTTTPVTLDAIAVIDDAPSQVSPFEIRTSSGTSVIVPSDFDESCLRRLLGVLSSC